MKKLGILVASLAAALIGATAAHATPLLDGQTVGYQYYYPDLSSPYSSGVNGNYVVGSGVEIANGLCCGFEASLDLSDTQIEALFHGSSSYSSGAFNGFVLTDVNNSIGAFTSVTINGATTLAGFDASRVSFDANNIYVNFQGLGFTSGDVVRLDLNGGSSTPVPEPMTLSLFAAGLAGAAAMRRKRKA